MFPFLLELQQDCITNSGPQPGVTTPVMITRALALALMVKKMKF